MLSFWLLLLFYTTWGIFFVKSFLISYQINVLTSFLLKWICLTVSYGFKCYFDLARIKDIVFYWIMFQTYNKWCLVSHVSLNVFGNYIYPLTCVNSFWCLCLVIPSYIAPLAFYLFSYLQFYQNIWSNVIRKCRSYNLNQNSQKWRHSSRSSERVEVNILVIIEKK